MKTESVIKSLLLVVLAVLISSTTARNCNYGFVPINGQCNVCGKTNFNPNVKIVGGTPAVSNSWPSQVYITQTYKTDFQFGDNGVETESVTYTCGGTLINDRTVLTAAHCIFKSFTTTKYGQEWTIPIVPNKYYRSYSSMMKVYLGAHNVSTFGEEAVKYPVREIPVIKITSHPKYDDNTLLNDITLYRLKTSVKSNSVIKYACLPQSQSNIIPKANVPCYVSGWGHLKEGGSSPEVLYNVKLRVYSSSSCQNVAPDQPKNWNSQICAGDSGGGLYIYDSSIGKYVVVGVVSYGDGCGKLNSPGLYTRVSYFLPWIQRNW